MHHDHVYADSVAGTSTVDAGASLQHPPPSFANGPKTQQMGARWHPVCMCERGEGGTFWCVMEEGGTCVDIIFRVLIRTRATAVKIL